MSEAGKLAGKVALVTGAAQGLGRAFTGHTIYPDAGRMALNYTVPVD
jgi:NADP-dependent 3-hydroxy acid dehydrogenase YdfG